MQLETPSGVRLFPGEPVVLGPLPEPDLDPGEEHYVQAVMNVGSVPIIEVGIHSFTLHWDGELLRTFPLAIRITEGAYSLPSAE
jgi:hypothetical protein